MGDRSIKKEIKKPKKTDVKTTVSTAPRPIMVQPELIRKVKKPK